MTSRNFRGFHSIQEVECSGVTLDPTVKLISLKLVKLPESDVLGSLNVIGNTCLTYGDYSSCIVYPDESHRSKLRVLVHDLSEGESREFGCTANTVNTAGDVIFENWKLLVIRISELCVLCLCLS
jgi:hypothetical protein